jgi:hypothetical protein
MNEADKTAENSKVPGKPFEKDDPRINRNGRPKGSISVVSAIKKKLEECPEGKEKTYLHYLVEKIMKKAIVDDDVAMIKDIINRVDGMPQQKTDITTDGESLNILGITYVQPKSGDNTETNTKATPSVSSPK